MKTYEKELVTELLKEKYVTRGELCDILHSSDRSVRAIIQAVKREYPVISTSSRSGYKIASTADDLPAVEDSLRNNRAKAISIFEGQKKLREFRDKLTHNAAEQLHLEF